MIQRAWRIYKDNASTFYDYRTNRKQGQSFRLLSTIFLSMLAATLSPAVSIDVLSATITVQAILIGFSFSVMFFLVQDTSDNLKKEANHRDYKKSLEKQLDEEQINLLSKELFWNISYFNIVSFLSLIIAIAMMMPNIWESVLRLFSELKFLNIDAYLFLLAANISAFIAQWIFAFLIIESAFTFVRTVGRVSFLFEQRMGGSA